jgi:N-acetylneuraminic acid mutarotase
MRTQNLFRKEFFMRNWGTVVVISAFALIGIAQAQDKSDASGQTLTVIHNTWSSGAPIPIAVGGSAVGVLKGQIYVVGGNHGTQIIAATQIYNPSTNTWSKGTALPTTISGASGAVVNGILYVFGGTSDSQNATNAVWGYNPATKKWTFEASMPTARWSTVAIVENKIVYVIGGYDGKGNFLPTVESYNPATNAWTEEAPLLGNKGQPAAGLLGTTLTGFTIVAADGATQPSVITGDTEGYDATTNTWRELAADPTARVATCFGAIGQKLYDVGGYLNNGGAAATVNESYTLSTNKWKTTLAPIPHGTMFPFSAVYNGKLYCFGGRASYFGSIINRVQIYQP